MIEADTVALYPFPPGTDYETRWRTLKQRGVLELPPRVPRIWAMTDGHSYVVEVRRGGDYRASVIEHAHTLESRGDTLVQRLGKLVSDWLTRSRQPGL